MTVKIQVRRDTSANWSSINPVLSLGEPGFETDTNKLKLGDGTSTWTSLNYVTPDFINIMSIGGIGDLTQGQQDQILEGTIVLTTDGIRWVYTGSGSKILEASYIQLADISPSWIQIGNKPNSLVGLADISSTASGDFILTSGNNLYYATNFAESVDDRTAQLLVAGTGVNLSYIDNSNTLTLNNTHTQVNVLSQEPQGFVNRDDSTISFNDSNRTFTIQPTGTSYDIYVKGIKVAKTGVETVVIGTGTNLNYLHFDINSPYSLQNKTTEFNFDTDVPIAYIHWNGGISQSTFFGEERHGIRMDTSTHKWIHNTFGLQYINGLSIGGYTLLGNGSSNSHAQINLSDGTLYQEDIIINVTDGAGAGTFTQELSPIAYIPTYYHSGSTGQWVRDSGTAFPLKYNATRAQYNLLSGATWTTPNVTNSRYFATWIVATNDINDPILAIVGQREDSSLNSAISSNTWSDIDLTNIPAQELKPLYRLIFTTSNSYTNTPKSSLQQILDLRVTVQSTAGSGVVQNDHGSLFGLADDDHAQYVHINNARTIDAVHTATNGLYVGSSNDNTITKILKQNTTDNTANVVLTTDGGAAGAGNRLVIPASTTWNFIIPLVAHNDTDHTAASWVFRGCLRRNNSNTTSLIESVISESWSEGGMSSTAASVVADDTNEALELRVTGLNSKNIRWVAAVNITQSIL
jgi:hypothetical protein